MHDEKGAFNAICGTSCLRCWRNKLKHQSPQAKQWMKNHPEERWIVTNKNEDEDKTGYICGRRMKRFVKRLNNHPEWKKLRKQNKNYQEKYDIWINKIQGRVPNNEDLRKLFESFSVWRQRLGLCL